MKIQDILLASNVKRWSIVNTVHDQSIAEHTFNVCMIARAIASEAGYTDDHRIIKYALDHDLDEIFTGDIPTPAKERMGIKGTDYNGKSKDVCFPDEVVIVKLADLIDAVYFIQDNAIGRHAIYVSGDITARYKKYCEIITIDGKGNLAEAAERVMEKIMYANFEAEQL